MKKIKSVTTKRWMKSKMSNTKILENAKKESAVKLGVTFVE